MTKPGMILPRGPQPPFVGRWRGFVVILVLSAALTPGCGGARPKASPTLGQAAASPAVIAQADVLWDKGPFAGSAADLLAVSASATGDASAVVILFEEQRHTFDAQGRCKKVSRFVYKVLTQAGVENWNSVQQRFSPWHQKEPRIRARVINPQGQMFELDPKTFERKGGAGSDDDVYTDDVIVRAPLPGLVVGAVVEQLVEAEETAPLFGAGTVSLFFFASEVPEWRARLIVEAPTSLPLRFTAKGPDTPTDQQSSHNGLVRHVFTGGPLMPLEEQPPAVPYDHVFASHVGFSTGRSWAEVADAYDRVLASRMQGGGLLKHPKVVASLSTAKGPLAKIKAVVESLHQQVRYTGIEFGEASIVPNTPAEVLKHGFGDCKDKSLLLVGALRELGIDAHLALLKAGYGMDVDTALPGLGRFNHAIVFVPATDSLKEPLWIDATARYVAVGDIPRSVQGRSALVIQAGIQELRTIPLLPDHANTYAEKRTIWLSEDAPNRVEERLFIQGAGAASFRSDHDGADPKKFREHMEKYTKSHYKSEKLVSASTSDPLAIDVPFEMKVEATDPGIAQVWYGGAHVEVPLANLFEYLPQELSDVSDLETKGEASEAGDHGDKAPKKKPRTVDYLMLSPYRYELQTRIVPPFGFVPNRLGQGRSWKLGEGGLTEEVSAQADGSVLMRHVLHTGPRRMTAAQLVAFRQGIKELYDAPMAEVSFVQEGEAHIEAGRTREGLATFRMQIAKQPEDPKIASRFARALLVAGLGRAARKYVDESLAHFGPKSDLLHAKGYILEHNEIGQAYAAGFDHAGAWAAYEKAESLPHKGEDITRALTNLASYEPGGRRSWPKPQLEKVLPRLKRLHDKGGADDTTAYLLALIKTQKWPETMAIAEKLKDSPLVLIAKAVAVAATQGPAAAIKAIRATRKDDKEQVEALRAGGSELMFMRRYPEAIALLEQAAKSHEKSAALRTLVRNLKNAKPWQTAKVSTKTPAEAALGFLIASLNVARGNSIDELKPFMAPPLRDLLTSEQGETMRKALLATGASVQLGEIPWDVALDLMTAVPLQVEGSDELSYRVTVPGEGGHRFFVERYDGKYGVVSAQGELTVLGMAAKRRLAKGDIKGARRWLDIATAGLSRQEDPLATAPLLHLWNPGFPASEEAARLAVAALTSTIDREASEPVLRGCIAKPTSEVALLGCESALFSSLFSAKKYAEAAKISNRWPGAFPDSQIALRFHFDAFLMASQLDNAERLLKAHDKSAALNDTVVRCKGNLLHKRGETAKAVKEFQRVIDSNKAQPADYNAAAWSAWLAGASKTASVQNFARTAVEKTNRKHPGAMNTLAAVLADAGQAEEAIAILREYMPTHAGVLSGSDQVVVGLVAEAYGQSADAAEMYRLVAASNGPNDEDAALFAQRRLKQIEARGKSVKVERVSKTN